MWKCQNCESLNNGKFCNVCGEAQPVENFYGISGQNCGQQVPSEPSVSYYAPTMTSQKKSKTVPIIIAVVAALVVLAVGVVVGFTVADNKKSTSRRTGISETYFADEGSNEKIDAYIEKSNVNGELDDLIENYKAQGILLDIFSSGDALVYRCDYTVQVADNVGELLKQNEERSSTLENAANMIKAEESAVKTVVYEYYDMDGNLLYSAEF